MSRKDLLERLKSHLPADEHEAAMLKRILGFVTRHEECFQRSLLSGHVTASAWVVDLERTHALLTHHAKLGKWLQMGGHCDGDSDVLKVALREVEEESGLTALQPLLGGAVFDVDAHEIPARGAEPAHIHYDIRFLFEADRLAPLRISGESHDLRWVAFEEIPLLNTDESVLRMLRKSPRRTDS
ncbi:MAG: NUDIX hydrolase [Bryobacteraceae bacterium]|jgi:8-oxo-dGTP pyrophosphatase MutT (NUDIX family)|nr:NUDIX hydrolase [Bryobacteraceae bacterium]